VFQITLFESLWHIIEANRSGVCDNFWLTQLERSHDQVPNIFPPWVFTGTTNSNYIVLEWCSILYNWGIQISSPIFPRSFPKRFWKKRTNSTVFYCRFFAEPPWHHSGTTALRRPRRPSLQGDHELDHGLLWVHHHLSPTAWIHQRVGFSPPVWRRKMQENKQNKQKHTLDDRMLATQS